MKLSQNTQKNLQIFLLFFCLFLLIHTFIPGFVGADSYYNARHAQLISENKSLSLVKPWIAFHFLSEAPADPYFLYHLIQSFFIGIFGIIAGTKILTSLLGATIFWTFFFVAKKLKTTTPLFWTFLFFISSNGFLYRTFLERAFVFSVTLFILSFYLTYKKRYFSLFFVSALFILFYNLAPIILAFPLTFLFVDLLKNKSKANIKPAIASLGGLAFGLILHPQTINYIKVIYIHTFEIFSLKIQGIALPIGQEIINGGLHALVAENILVIPALFYAVTLYAIGIKNQKLELHHHAILLMTAAWSIVTYFVIRGVEYWVPSVWLLIVALKGTNINIPNAGKILPWIRQNIGQKARTALCVLVIVLAVSYTALSIYSAMYRNKFYEDLISYQRAGQILNEKTHPNEVIFNTVWSDFPKFFYFAPDRRYVTGFGPTFLYDYNPEMYWAWFNISHNGFYCPHIIPCDEVDEETRRRLVKPALNYIFETKTIITSQESDSHIYKLLKANPNNFEQIFEDSRLIIYQTK